jgi:hypothetical protein
MDPREKTQQEEQQFIECYMPNQRAVRALIAGGYTCEQVGPSPFLYRTNAPLQDGVAFETGGETLIRRGDKVFPVANRRSLEIVERLRSIESELDA